jgi:hypothetical protein
VPILFMTLRELRTSVKTNLWKFTVPEVLYYSSLTIIGLLLLLLIIATKSRTAIGSSEQPILLAYTILITTFELSRLIAAMFYSNTVHLRKMSAEDRAKANEYEPTASFVIPCYNEGTAIEKNYYKMF